MQATGALEDDGRTLLLTRELSVEVDQVWSALTESALLGRWFGTWTGDPADGSVMVTMTAEAEPVEAARYEIHDCDRPRLLSFSSAYGNDRWRLSVTLAPAGAGAAGGASPGTRLELRHHEVDLAALRFIGPGWEWYLDRLAAVLHGEPLPGLSAFDTEYMSLGDAYAGLTG